MMLVTVDSFLGCMASSCQLTILLVDIWTDKQSTYNLHFFIKKGTNFIKFSIFKLLMSCLSKLPVKDMLKRRKPWQNFKWFLFTSQTKCSLETGNRFESSGQPFRSEQQWRNSLSKILECKNIIWYEINTYIKYIFFMYTILQLLQRLCLIRQGSTFTAGLIRHFWLGWKRQGRVVVVSLSFSSTAAFSAAQVVIFYHQVMASQDVNMVSC